MTASRATRYPGVAGAEVSAPSSRRSRQVHAANPKNAMAAANAIGRSATVTPRKCPTVTDRPCTTNAAIATPDRTTHQRCRSAYVIVINCDLSPSSATNTTPRLMSAAEIMSDLATRRPAPTIAITESDYQARAQVRRPVSAASNVLMPQAASPELQYRGG